MLCPHSAPAGGLMRAGCVAYHHHASLLKSSIRQAFCCGAWGLRCLRGLGISWHPAHPSPGTRRMVRRGPTRLLCRGDAVATRAVPLQGVRAWMIDKKSALFLHTKHERIILCKTNVAGNPGMIHFHKNISLNSNLGPVLGIP